MSNVMPNEQAGKSRPLPPDCLKLLALAARIELLILKISQSRNLQDSSNSNSRLTPKLTIS
jgi:hypothetical protein